MSKMPSPLAAEPETLAAPPELTVVVPVLNEERNVPLIAERLTGVLQGCVASHEILFIDDGSRDGTLAAIRALAAADPRIRCISFSRNFGKEVALAAGLDHARGEGVVMIDADLQHPPETIPRFVEKWREGYDMVYGQRTDRSTDGRTYSGFARRFYRLFERFAETPLPEGAGDFRLVSRRVVEALKRLPSGRASRKASSPGSASARSGCPTRWRRGSMARRSGTM